MNNEALVRNPRDGKLYRFHRICRLPECTVDIYTNKKDHGFCCTNHQQEYWKRIRRGERIFETEIIEQRKEIEEIKEKLGMK